MTSISNDCPDIATILRRARRQLMVRDLLHFVVARLFFSVLAGERDPIGRNQRLLERRAQAGAVAPVREGLE